jgi:hypothetical protein
MPKIRNMRVDDVEAVARMDALDHDRDPERVTGKPNSIRWTI